MPTSPPPTRDFERTSILLPVSVAATRAVELGFSVFACASTGNLANSVSSHAARLGLECMVFIPNDLEPSKVLGSAIYGPKVFAVAGNYDDVNRLCSELADNYNWAFVNVNVRPYYSEGSKTLGFEVAEQLGWRRGGATGHGEPRSIIPGS
mgnify:CR=1 FL=1